jgi:hypothetical protein
MPQSCWLGIGVGLKIAHGVGAKIMWAEGLRDEPSPEKSIPDWRAPRPSITSERILFPRGTAVKRNMTLALLA